MTDEPSEIPSDGDSPTYFDGEPAGPPPSAPSLPSDEKPTFFDDEARRLLDPGTELPPDLAAEHQAVYLRPGDLVTNRFQVIKLLGFGGMGAVYRVRDRVLNEDRALKVMLPSLLRSETARQRFLSEVRISQKLNHDRIVRVHDLGEDPGRGFRFFTMEYIEGQTLNRLLKERGGKLPVDEALDITRQLCDALEYAHQHTVHRDLKPQNVMVQPDGRIKVLDFGLAKLMSPGRMARSSMALGTAYYQAPEQSVHLGELDQRADIYSLGVLLYQMLTGEIPVGRFGPPSNVVPSLPKALDEVVLRCLEPKPDNRHESVAGFRGALAAAGHRKRRGLLAAVLAALILTAVAVAASLWIHYGQPEPIEPPGPVAAESAAEAQPPAPDEQPTPTEEPGQHEEIPEPEATVAQGPEAPSEPEREGEAPSEPSPPTATASEASAAKIAAQKAEKAALTAGADTHAAELLGDAVKLLEEAEVHDSKEAFADASAKYADADAAFGKAERQAAAITAEIAALEHAQSTMDDARQEADALEAKTWAKVRYDQAAKLEEEARTALSIGDRPAATGLFKQAAQRYALAVSEAKQQGEAMVAAARNAAAKAKQAAQTDDVKRHASAELAEADGLMDQAQAAGSDYERAKALYEKAAAKYAEAVGVTPGRKQAEEERIAAEKEAEAERVAQSKAAMETARAGALTAKNKIGADERKYASKEVGAGDSTWDAAGAVGSDYAKAERQFKLAKASYDEALRVTPDRVKAAQGPQPGETYVEDLGGGVTLEMVWIPSGRFQMGSPSSEEKRDDDEGPVHTVELDGFWLGKYEVTQAQWQAVMGNNPSHFKGADLPVESVSWEHCQEFIGKLNAKSQRRFGLPTEAQWEYACRAGTTTPFHFGETISTEQANYDGNDTYGNGRKGVDRKETTSVGSFPANRWGLHDMHGNLREWCADWYDEDYYGKSPRQNPTGPSSGADRVLRGGSWGAHPCVCRSANRYGTYPTSALGSVGHGFRVCCVVPAG